MSDWIETDFIIDKKKKRIIIPIKDTAIYAKYLYYILEYHNIPKNYAIIFVNTEYSDIDDFIAKEKIIR